MKPLIKMHNLETDEIIEREMNAEEFAQFTIDKAKSDADKETEAAKEAAKVSAASKLSALGLTVDDLKALGL
jgi:hypothetical protein